jgi:catechol 2,3-dioxygenase-like lactoylglutathione lyase family enzyme
MTLQGVRTAVGLHHVGITVENLERSIEFYANVFGADLEWSIESAGEGAEAVSRVPGADMRIASLRLPYGRLELFEFAAPRGRPNDGVLNDIGATHICLEVADVDAVYARVQELGLRCWYAPIEVTQGLLAGQRFFFFEDPDGLKVEVLTPAPSE